MDFKLEKDTKKPICLVCHTPKKVNEIEIELLRKEKENNNYGNKYSDKINLKSNGKTVILKYYGYKSNAKVGAKLPGGVIESRSVRGVLSNGMICSLAELGLENKYLTEEDKKGIHILSDDAPVGIDALSYLMLDDTYIDFELTANRSDLLSMRGMSYEIGDSKWKHL